MLLDSTQLGCGKVKGGEGPTAGREGERKRINRKASRDSLFPKKRQQAVLCNRNIFTR